MVVAVQQQIRDFAFWNVISATPLALNLDAGAYGLTLHAGVWGTAALQRLLPDLVTFVTVSTVFAADGYQEIHLPAGTYQLTLTGVTGLVGEIAKIASGSG